MCLEGGCGQKRWDLINMQVQMCNNTTLNHINMCQLICINKNVLLNNLYLESKMIK